MMPFAQTKALEAQVDEFMDIIVKGVLTLKQAVTFYLGGRREEFEERIQTVSTLENRADEIRKHTETTLYTHSLIPESRGDVLGLLEHMDNVIDAAKGVLQSFAVQNPEIPEAYHAQFLHLTELSVQAVEQVILAARAFFREVHAVRDYINKVDFYESEADDVGHKLKKAIFSSDMDLAHKMHVRYFAERIESISDLAEHVGERLAIATIKRTV